MSEKPRSVLRAFSGACEIYEYKFIKLNLGLFSGKPEQDYHDIIQQHGEEGWRLIQIFDPGTGIYGAAKYFELIFERDLILKEKSP